MSRSILQYAGCYTLDLYCRNVNAPRHQFNNGFEQFTGRTFTECAKEAKSIGWTIRASDRTAVCPTCNQEEK